VHLVTPTGVMTYPHTSTVSPAANRRGPPPLPRPHDDAWRPDYASGNSAHGPVAPGCPPRGGRRANEPHAVPLSMAASHVSGAVRGSAVTLCYKM